jgi:stage II sporulation protein D
MIPAGCRRRTIEPTFGADSSEQTWIKVLLFGNLRECTIASINGFQVEDADGGMTAEFMTNHAVRVVFRGADIVIGEHHFGHTVVIKPHTPYVIFEIEGKPYRGYLRLQVRPDENGFDAVNQVPLESYLFGVVGAEMQSYWEPEALKAQAVVSRTYCLYMKNRFGQFRSWDLMQSEANQVYRGIEAETPIVRQTVLETAGQVLISEYPDGSESLFPTYYSSSCGGHTEPSQNVFGGPAIRPLSGVECPYCKGVARHRDFNWPPAAYTQRQISDPLMQRYSSLEWLQEITDFEISRTGYLGRVTQVRLIGKNGKTDTVRGEDFRLSIDPTGRKLKSCVFTVEKTNQAVMFQNGLGFGHGVGLCQCGAEGLARSGSDYRDILDFYFPASRRVIIETSIEP